MPLAVPQRRVLTAQLLGFMPIAANQRTKRRSRGGPASLEASSQI